MRTLRLLIAVILSNLYLFASGQYSASSSIAASYAAGTSNSASAWNNLTYLQNSDNQFTSSIITSTYKSTNEIDAVNWGFQNTNGSLPNYIPKEAIINGIEVTVRLKKSLYGNVRDNKIILLKGGKEIGNNKATTASWPSTVTNVVYGSSVDTWGNSLSATDIASQDFGVRISAKQKGKKDVQPEVDHIKVTIYFNQKYFYSKSTGNLESLSTWGANSNGTGTEPLNFSSDGQVFFLKNRATTSLTGNLSITGSNAKMVIGDGTAAFPTALTIPANYKLASSVEVSANSSLIISNTTAPTILSAGDKSTVTYNAQGDQPVSTIPYYNLIIGGSGNKSLSANALGLCVINNVLTINAGATLNNQGSQVLVLGSTNGIVNNGIATGAGNYTYEVLDGNTSISGAGVFSNLEINAELSNNGTSVIALSNPTTITGSLTLSDGLFSNGSNLTMAAGSYIKVVDGSLGKNIVQSNLYDLVYSSESLSVKSTGNELAGNVRDLTIQLPSGSTLNLSAPLTVGRDLLISTGTLDVTSSNYNITVGGNYTNRGTFMARNGTLTFNGASVQTISGTSAQNFYNLIVNNATGGSVQLNTPVNVGNVLTLTKGIVTSSSINLLSLSSAATLNGGSSNSYISGPLGQTLAAASGTKTFPIGKSGLYKPAILTLNQKTSASTTYTAEVFDGAPPTRTLPSSLRSISDVRYYTISSSDNANLSSAVVSLTYDVNDQISDNSLLRIAKSQGSEWINIEGAASNLSGAGTITSTSFYSFSDFVFAKSATPDAVTVLPLTWLSFNGVKKQNGIELTWQTANEVNTSHFLIERSNDRANWKTIATVKSKGFNANSYAYTDLAPLEVNYYRIRQVDVDGKFEYSKVISIRNKVENKQFSVQPNPVTGSRFNCFIPNEQILAAQQVTVRVYDISGKVIFTTSTAPSMYLPIDCSAFKPGMYILTIQGGNKTQQTKFILR